MKGGKADISHVDKVIYVGVKQDVLNIIEPLRKGLQNNSLLHAA